MDCREFRATLTSKIAPLAAVPRDTESESPLLALPAEARAHCAGCSTCDREARALILVRLGSSLVADQPRDGFEGRLRARIAAEGIDPADVTWADGVGMVARPALGVAMLAMVAALAWSGWQSTHPSTDDFGLLAGADGVLDSVLVDDLTDTDSAALTGAPDPAGDAP